MSCQGACGDCACKEAAASKGDGGFWEVAGELWPLHVEKADGYGVEDEPFANYIAASEAVGEPDEFTCWLRIFEKTTRALNLIRAGRADENLEGLDVAALACGAEALRRRRL